MVQVVGPGHLDGLDEVGAGDFRAGGLFEPVAFLCHGGELCSNGIRLGEEDQAEQGGCQQKEM